MDRKEKVYNTLKKFYYNTTNIDIESKSIGIDTLTISDITKLDRSNVSRELNKLVDEGKVVKIIGRPVRFIEKEALERCLNIKLEDKNTIEDIESLVSSVSHPNINDPFKKLIGFNEGLDLQIKQAKAAVLYPPRGLHTLLIGPTGVGKTTFAEIMYEHAKYTNIINRDAKFVVFNCAEYTENPQLILSQLFGHVKGAFTGGDKDKAGLVELADGGILFLDEIHRLPPEGQEMLFFLMDKGIYRKLGETENNRKANVLIICATTEDLNQLLKTFLRRIPMVINIPSLNERGFSERLQLIENFFVEEAVNISNHIKVYKDVLIALLLYNCVGNIGQLKGDIQLLCARAFLDYKTYNKKEIEIDTSILPEHIYNGLLNYGDKRDEVLDFIKVSKEYYLFRKRDFKNFGVNDKHNLFTNIYKEIIFKHNEFQKIGYSTSKINRIISDDIEKYLKKLLEKFNVKESITEKDKLFKLISPKIYYAVEGAITLAEQKLKRKISNKAKIGLAMHVSALLERIANGEIVYNEEINKIALNNPEEFNVAMLIREVLGEELGVNIPKEETVFLTMFLSTVDLDKNNKKVGIIVLAHGDNTATSISKVVNNLLDTDHCKAIDMPLNTSVEDVLNKTINKVIEINEGEGVLLLVDMGSLTAFADIVSKRTGIKVKFLDMVSSPIVIEAVRKSFITGMNIDKLVNELKTYSPYMGRIISGDVKSKAKILSPKIILTTCTTGIGAAERIKVFLENTLIANNQDSLIIKALDMTSKKNIGEILNEEELNNLIAIVGTIDLHINGVPFIPIDELVVGNGINNINKLLNSFADNHTETKIHGENVLISVLNKTLLFLDPEKAYKLTIKSFESICDSLDIKDERSLLVRYVIHCACMIERLIQNESLPYKEVEKLINLKMKEYTVIKNSIVKIEEYFGISIPNSEIGYIIEIIDTVN